MILCGGMGTRLKSVTGDKPKVMAGLSGKPFLDLLVAYLSEKGYKRIVLCTGYGAEFIETYYSQQDTDIEFVFSREEKPLGTGGALAQAQKCVKSERFFVFNGDCFCAADLNAVQAFHQTKGGIGTVVVSRVKDGKDFGRVELDEEGRITAFREKDAEQENIYVNAGIYCLSKDVFSSMPDQDNFSLEYDCFPRWIEQGLSAFVTPEKFYDIGTPERYEEAQQALAQKRGQ